MDKLLKAFYLKRTGRLILPILLIFGVNACSAVLEQPVYATITPTTSPSPSSTIIWFPATSTATLAPTLEPAPTENLHPAVGEVLYRDDFTDEGSWSTRAESGGKIVYGKQELTLAVQDAKTYIASFYTSPDIENASIEITSTVSLCKAEDSYGILFRAANAMNGYRYSANCLGKVKLELLKSGKAYIIKDWTQSGQILPGSPYQARLMVWMVNDELRFFVNDIFQFSARDLTYPKGKVGVFARQAADTPITVSFSDLIVRGILPDFVLPKATPNPTATRPAKLPPMNTVAPSPKP